MLRKAVIILSLVMLASSASAVDVSGISGTVTMNLNITPYAAVMLGTGGDEVINFSSDIAGGAAPDYYRPFGLVGGERGVYNPLVATDVYPSTGDKPPTDPWANGYYESFDGADYWLTSNGGTLNMGIASAGGLTNGSHVLNTWFTLAASGPFTLNGVQLNDGTIPLDGIGSYFADETPADLTMEVGGTAFWPNQFNFNMVSGGPWGYAFTGVCSGSLKFLGRVERNNISDPTGSYTTSLTVTFW